MEIFGTIGQASPMSIFQSGLNSNSSEILCLSRPRLSARLIKIQSNLKLLCSNMVFFGTQGKVIPKSIVRSRRNSNSSEIS